MFLQKNQNKEMRKRKETKHNFLYIHLFVNINIV
jgi:hypothetical protein